LCQIHNPKNPKSPDVNQRFRPSDDGIIDPRTDETALHHAARLNLPGCVAGLLESVPGLCEVSARNMQGMTALHIAARMNHTSVVRELIEILDENTMSLLDSEDIMEMTPIYYACMFGHLDVVKILCPYSDLSTMCRAESQSKRKLKSKVDGSQVVHDVVNEYSKDPRDNVYQPALLAAVRNGHVEIVNVLITCGADVNQTDNFGHTGLSLAAKAGNFYMVQTLLTNGADTLIQSHSGGGTPLQKAKKYKHHKVVELLEKYLSK